MKNYTRFTTILILLLLLCSCSSTANVAVQQQPDSPKTEVQQLPQWIDYVSQLKLDMGSATVKQVVTVRNYVDGDTTHFHVPETLVDSGVLKARYLAVNTPESTGKIEEYGKTASNFTKEKLSTAVSILIESDDENLNLDSTGSRHLVWVWYKPSENEDYRNLNLELLQNGLAIASSAANNRYGSYCTAAIAQARAYKMNVYSGEKDPNFYYGDAIELTLRELRSNIAQYDGMKVAFEGVVAAYYNNGIYVEDYDSETDTYNGMYVYIGYSLKGSSLEILNVGNRARIVGTVSYYEGGGTYQVSGLSYKASKPDDPSNIKLISTGNKAGYHLVSADRFVNGVEEVEVGDEVKQYSFAELALGTSIEMDNLQVKSVYTTKNEDSSSYGAMTLYCEQDGIEVQVRTLVFTDSNRNLITADAYEGRNINVQGFVDYYENSYQIKVLMADRITINE